MRLQRPFEAITPTVDGAVLQVLAGADSTFTVSQVTTLVGDASPAGVRNVLNRLSEQGLVQRETDGVAYRYRLNRDHLLAGPVVAIAGARDELRWRTAALVEAWDEPASLVVLFGSAARGDMRVGSDLDVLVVGDGLDDHWWQQVDELATAMTAWTGNDTRPLTMTVDEFTERASDDAVLVQIGRDGRPLYGDESLLGPARAAALRQSVAT